MVIIDQYPYNEFIMFKTIAYIHLKKCLCFHLYVAKGPYNHVNLFNGYRVQLFSDSLTRDEFTQLGIKPKTIR